MLEIIENKINYKRWLNNGPCIPQIAACLILNLDPDKYVKKNDRDYRDVQIKNKQAEVLTSILCNNDLPWNYNDLNIFCHVNNALKNQIDIHENLFKEIELFFLNLIEDHQNGFMKTYPYLARKINSLKNKIHPESNVAARETRIQRDDRVMQRGAEIQKNNPSIQIKDIQKQLLEEEKSKSKITESTLRKIITKKAIKNTEKPPH